MIDPKPEDNDDGEWVEITAFGDSERRFIRVGNPARVKLGDPIEIDDDDDDDMGWELWPDMGLMDRD